MPNAPTRLKSFCGANQELPTAHVSLEVTINATLSQWYNKQIINKNLGDEPAQSGRQEAIIVCLLPMIMQSGDERQEKMTATNGTMLPEK